MADKNGAADALVAALRQKRKLRQDSLQASFRERTPEPDSTLVNDVNEDERGDVKNLDDTLDEGGHFNQGQKSETSLIGEGDGGGDDNRLPTLKDDDSADRKEESLPSQSGPSSVRERMRQKMLARRERPQAADGETSEREGSKSLSMTSRRLRGLRDAKTMSRTRFDGAESKDDDELEQELAAR